jgi:membrane protease YdiL (CAAX protease family)
MAWLLALPLWLGGGLNSSWFLPLAVGIMFTPTAAAVVVSRTFEPGTRFLRETGVAIEKGRLGVTVLYCLMGVGLAFILSLGALALAAALGLFTFDIEHFSAFRALLEAKLPGHILPASLPPLWVLVVSQMVAMLVLSPVNALAAIGEEIGWRGWLLPRLMPLGTAPAIVLTGVIWGCWHAPLILLGYNYGKAPGWIALCCMSGMCISIGIVLAWLRLRSRSVWPCALTHGAVNAAAGLYVLLGTAGKPVDMTQVTLLGWSGWILPVAVGIMLFAVFRERKAPVAMPAL